MFIPNTIFCVFILKKKNAHEFSKNSFLTQYFENCFHMKNKNMNAIIKQTLGFQCKTSFFFSNEKKKENLIDFLLLNFKKKRGFSGKLDISSDQTLACSIYIEHVLSGNVQHCFHYYLNGKCSIYFYFLISKGFPYFI